MTKPKINKTTCKRLLRVVDAGLVNGMGNPVPGQMCVEAAVCYALGQAHGDEPTCVGLAVRAAKIVLNDASWSSDMARASGLRRVAVAQLGSDGLDQIEFVRRLAEHTIRRIVPMALRAVAAVVPSHSAKLILAADGCEQAGTADSALAASVAASAFCSYAASVASAASIVSAAGYAAASYAAHVAASVASADASYAAHVAASAASVASAASTASVADQLLIEMANIIEAVLVEMESPGCKYLYLCDE